RSRTGARAGRAVACPLRRGRPARARPAAPPAGAGTAARCLTRRRPCRHDDPRQKAIPQMKTSMTGGALARLAAIAVPARAQDEAEPIVVQTPLIRPAAGLMNEHVHEGGEFMIGARFERTHAGGRNQSGTTEISDPEIVAAGYGARATSMTMDMAMLDLMYAP